MRKTTAETLAQKLPPLLKPDFDQFDDDELEVAVRGKCLSPS